MSRQRAAPTPDLPTGPLAPTSKHQHRMGKPRLSEDIVGVRLEAQRTTRAPRTPGVLGPRPGGRPGQPTWDPMMIISALLARLFPEEAKIIRRMRVRLRDMEVRHAKERAALTAWMIEAEYYLRERDVE